ncbi:hypothetical protein [Methylocystis sp. S23]|jgi:hypothetical protein
MQAEHVATDYQRDMTKILQARANGVFAPGGSAPLNDYNIVGASMPGRQGFYFNGAHPDLFEARAQVYW